MFEFSALAGPFSYKDEVTSGRDAVFGDFCNDNVCACAVSTLIIPVANLSTEMDLAAPIFDKTQVNSQNRELSYAHAHRSLRVTSPKELVLFLGTLNPHAKFD